MTRVTYYTMGKLVYRTVVLTNIFLRATTKREHADNFVNFQTVYFILILRDSGDADDNGDDC